MVFLKVAGWEDTDLRIVSRLATPVNVPTEAGSRKTTVLNMMVRVVAASTDPEDLGIRTK